MAVDINFSSVIGEIFSDTTQTLNGEKYGYGENINWIGIIIPKRTAQSASCCRVMLQENPKISCDLEFHAIDGMRLCSCVQFSHIVTNKHYQITLYYLNSKNKVEKEDSINLTNITKSTMYNFKKQFYLREIMYKSENICILCKIIEIKITPVKMDISKNLMSTKCLSLYEEKKLSDFKIICDDQEIYVHKIILVCQSDVFQAMFENPMKESRDDVLVINDFELKIVELMIRYLYTDEMTEKLSEEELKQLFLIANKYNLEKLKKICLTELCSLITDYKKALNILAFFESYNFGDINDLMIQFIKDNKEILM
ncbi:speckle-type POZ protein-like [Leptopilina heterotoma]|uniref:speckle-type POZ protein-like n=1 Tax=Leptopilina heterotoma TaxID=63436 RepID=UPI001CA9AFA4|nr:speckle-type POZ protein-like [Leptopilina heterotoma]